MKKILLLTAFLLASLLTEARKLNIIPGSDGGYIVVVNSTKASPFLPGDTVLVPAAYKWSYISLTNLYGTAAKPIVFMNSGGQTQMTDGFAIENCQYVKVVGKGSADKYGFHIQDPNSNGVAINIFGRSANVEVSYIDICHKTYGFWVKEEQQCYDSLNALTLTNPSGWTITNISIHDNHILKTNQEGMYLGSTDPNGTRGVSCNGKTIYPIAIRLSGIQVYNNIIDSCNRSGIQLSGAPIGPNRIYNNHITHVGLELSTIQGPGIWLGGFTSCRVDHNTISSTYLSGIFCLGAGLQQVDSNTIDSSGILGTVRVNGMDGIALDTRQTGNPVDSALFVIFGNTIRANTDTSIHIMNTYCCYGAENRICSDNVYITPFGISYPVIAKFDPPNVTVDKTNKPIVVSIDCNLTVSPPANTPIVDTIDIGTFDIQQVNVNGKADHYTVTPK